MGVTFLDKGRKTNYISFSRKRGEGIWILVFIGRGVHHVCLRCKIPNPNSWIPSYYLNNSLLVQKVEPEMTFKTRSAVDPISRPNALCSLLGVKYALPHAHCLVFQIHCTLLTTHWSVVNMFSYFSKILTWYALLITYCSLFTFHCSWLTARLSGFTDMFCLPPTACYSLLIGHCSLLTLCADWPLLTAHCSLFTAHFSQKPWSQLLLLIIVLSYFIRVHCTVKLELLFFTNVAWFLNETWRHLRALTPVFVPYKKCWISLGEI